MDESHCKKQGEILDKKSFFAISSRKKISGEGLAFSQNN